MSPIDWDQSFSVGHPMVDDQHREFLTLMNTMENLDFTDSGTCNQYHRLNILKTLLKYTEKHFRLENKLMQEFRYPDAYNHWRSHKNFDLKIYTLYRKVLAGELVFDISIFMMFRDKFRNHILKEDKLMFQSIFSHEPQPEFLDMELALATSEENFTPNFQP